jgi:enamine deaminase RidA (YjgF/YER057c/UK114 family)
MHQILHPQGWPRPAGYAHGIAASGRQVYVSGQIGWTPAGRFEAPDLPAQVGQALRNAVAVLGEAGAAPEHVVRMTWYIVSREDYLANAGAIGVAYREVMGKYFPAMSVVEVAALLEEQALVEIEVTAVVPA